MDLLILGKSNDDRGAQLESLTAALLRKLGYEDVTTNHIGAGGNEIDIRAQKRVPSLGGAGHAITVICECKATERPAEMTDWLKFLGKLYYEDARVSRPVAGCFIAMSGVRGSVEGHFTELALRRETIELVTGSRLLELVRAEYTIPDLSAVLAYVRAHTDREPSRSRLAYYQNLFRVVVEFVDTTYVVVRACDSGLKQDVDPTIAGILNDTLAVGTQVNLAEERLAQGRRTTIRKGILGELFLTGGAMRHVELSSTLVREACFGLVKPLAADDVDAAIDDLERKALVRRCGDEICFSDELARSEILAVFLRESTIVPPLGCTGYDTLIDADLLDEILRRHSNPQLPEDAREECLRILRWSPSALMWSLTPDPILRSLMAAPNPVHRAQAAADAVRYFRGNLVQRLYTDFQNPGLEAYWVERRGITEIELDRHVTVKGPGGTLLTWSVGERHGVARAAPDLGGGYVHVWLSGGAPQPSEWAPRDARDHVGPEGAGSGGAG